MDFTFRHLILLSTISLAAAVDNNANLAPQARSAPLLGVAYSAATDVSHISFQSPLVTYGSALSEIQLPAPVAPVPLQQSQRQSSNDQQTSVRTLGNQAQASSGQNSQVGPAGSQNVQLANPAVRVALPQPFQQPTVQHFPVSQNSAAQPGVAGFTEQQITNKFVPSQPSIQFATDRYAQYPNNQFVTTQPAVQQYSANQFLTGQPAVQQYSANQFLTGQPAVQQYTANQFITGQPAVQFATGPYASQIQQLGQFPQSRFQPAHHVAPLGPVQYATQSQPTLGQVAESNAPGVSRVAFQGVANYNYAF